MPILNYTTKVDVYTTVGQIQGTLVKHGARRIVQDYDKDGKVVAVCFLLDTPMGEQGVRLPANADKVYAVLQRQKVRCDYAQAERVAWRIVKDWIEAQMAILESEMVTVSEIFLPYMVNAEGKTLYELFESKQLLLGGKSDE